MSGVTTDLMPLPAEKGLKHTNVGVYVDGVKDLMPLPAEKGLKPAPEKLQAFLRRI